MKNEARILVVDDSEVILSRIQAVLLAEGYEVVTTTQTVGAARHLRNCDLVIVDYHMPGLDGAAVTNSLRAAAGDNPPLFYLYTTDPAAAANHAEYGFDGFFTRKGDLNALPAQVRAALRLRKLAKMQKPGRP